MLEFLIIAFSSALQFPGCYSLISSYIYRSDKPPENSIFFFSLQQLKSYLVYLG